MQVHQPWHSGMLIWTWRDAPGWKEINKCRSISHGIWECSLGHGWMYLAGKKEINAGPSAMAFRNAHLDTDECTCPERNKKMQVHQPWHSRMSICPRKNAPVWKLIKKCRSVSHGIRECPPAHGRMHLSGN